MRKNKNSHDQSPEKEGSWKLFLHFFQKTKIKWWMVLILVVFSLSQSKLSLLIPDSMGALFSGDFSMKTLMLVIVASVGSLAITVVSSILQMYVSALNVKSMRVAGWKRMMNAKASFYDRHNPQELLTALTNDAREIVDNLLSVLTSTPAYIYYIVGALLMIREYHWKLALITLVTIPFELVYAIVYGRLRYKNTYAIQNRIGGLTGWLAERLRNLPLIKSSAAEKKEDENGQGVINNLYKAYIRSDVTNSVGSTYSSAMKIIVNVAAIVWGAMLLRNGEVTVDQWIAFFLYLPTVTSYVDLLAYMWTSIKNLQGFIVRYTRILDAPAEIDEHVSDETPELPKGDLAFDHVSFGYGDKPVLKDVSFSIPAGKVTAVVGASGSGKTTALKLIERFYQPQEGTVKLGGMCLDDLDIRAYRRSIAYVQQESSIFSGTIRDSLCYGSDKNLSDQKLIEVCKLAGFYDTLEKIPGGLDADLSAWGASLSGGQRQRLVIARELLRDADTILLDEPTSSLDTETAASVADTIYRQFKGKTIVTVTHELNFISGADQIIVMDEGRVVGQGTHEELVKSCDSYRTLVEEQSYQEVFA